ncbi:MAG: outer membrane beta-barrel protein [Bdellovibrionales bacterium]|nr:outer membrane beta-barrel protein [Bdellovibrionales bacterium]
MHERNLSAGRRGRAIGRLGLAVLAWAALAAVGALAPAPAEAQGLWEYSLGFSFQRSNYSDESFAWVRRWGTSLGYQFSNHSAIEVSYQDVYQKTYLHEQQDTRLYDRILSANWVLNITPRDALIRPYFKVGGGHLWRDTSSKYASGDEVVGTYDSLSAIIGLGVKWYVAGQVAVRAEAGSYLEGANIATWEDNVSINLGFSVYF